MDSLARLTRLTSKRAATENEWRAAIRQCVEDGVSLREVGKAAGVSHVRVLQITRD